MKWKVISSGKLPTGGKKTGEKAAGTGFSRVPGVMLALPGGITRHAHIIYDRASQKIRYQDAYGNLYAPGGSS